MPLMADLYIPKRIRVGFQKRDDTFTKLLAYIICYDQKGKLRKEGSWENWRDKKIKPQEFDNVPHSGFILNKGHTRYNYSHFGNSRRSVVRVYDDRGIEFEISPENCVSLLMETTCSKRVIDGECVYAWAGKDLVLLPVGSETYQEAVIDTKRNEMKVSAKELKPGCSYTTKKNEEVIYIGRYNWFEWKGYGNGRISKKAHIWAHPTKPKYGEQFFPRDVAFVAFANSPDPVANYAEFVDTYNATPHSGEVVNWEYKPITPSIELAQKSTHYDVQLKRSEYAKVTGDRIDFYSIYPVTDRQYYGDPPKDLKITTYIMDKAGSINTKNCHKMRESGYNGYGYYNNWQHRGLKQYSEAEILSEMAKMVDVYMVLESGKKLKVKSLSDYSS